MSKITSVNLDYISQSQGEVSITYDSHQKFTKRLKILKDFTLNLEYDFHHEDKIIGLMHLPEKEKIERGKCIEFVNCVFTNEIDWNMYTYNSKIIFKKCIFLSNITLFGDFRSTISFEESVFFNSNVSFQESIFESFSFKSTEILNSTINFQQTMFYDPSPCFNNISMKKSSIAFLRTEFLNSKNDLLDFLSLQTDMSSKILFRSVNLQFNEVRFDYSNIFWLEFIESSFDCNHFKLNIECTNLIFQNSVNRGALSFDELKRLNNLNIYDLRSTNPLTINSPEVSKMLSNAINTSKEIIWTKAYEYRKPSVGEIEKQTQILGIL